MQIFSSERKTNWRKLVRRKKSLGTGGFQSKKYEYIKISSKLALCLPNSYYHLFVSVWFSGMLLAELTSVGESKSSLGKIK